MSSPNNDSNANDTSQSRAASTLRLNNSPPTSSAPNMPSISSSDDSVDLAAAMDPNNNHDSTRASFSRIDGVEQMNAEAPEPPVSMTAVAAIIIAKQRRGAPGVEQDGVHDAAPTPYVEAPDGEDNVGKSLGTSRNNYVEDDIEEGGARPFDSVEFENGAGEEEGGNKEIPALPGNVDFTQDIANVQNTNTDVEVNAGRPLHQAVTLPTRSPPRSMLPNANDEESIPIEAMLVPNEPVYELQPVPAWYRQKKARPFFAFACFMFIAAVVVISVLLASSSPDESSPNTTVVTFVSLASFAPSISFVPSTPPSLSPSMTQSTQPSTLPSIVPSTTSHPSTLPSSSFSPSSSPTNKCFDNKEQLKGAIISYIGQDCAENENCDMARLYGHPMNSWCVGQITDMSELFSEMYIFNEDISAWDVSSVTNMRNMFYRNYLFNGDLSGWDISSVMNMKGMFLHATRFNQDLCAWSDKFPYGAANDIFSNLGCTFVDSPNEQQGGPFCASSCSK